MASTLIFPVRHLEVGSLVGPESVSPSRADGHSGRGPGIPQESGASHPCFDDELIVEPVKVFARGLNTRGPLDKPQVITVFQVEYVDRGLHGECLPAL